MSGAELTGVAASFGFLIVITLLEWRGWLPAKGKVKFAIVFAAGAAIIGSLYATGIPPAWFDGGKEAFGIAVMLMLSGFVAEREKGRTYGLPLFGGMGATMVVLNVLEHV